MAPCLSLLFDKSQGFEKCSGATVSQDFHRAVQAEGNQCTLLGEEPQKTPSCLTAYALFILSQKAAAEEKTPTRERC